MGNLLQPFKHTQREGVKGMTAPNFDEAVRAILKTDSELYKAISKSTFKP